MMKRWIPIAVLLIALTPWLGACTTVGEPIAAEMITRVGEQRDSVRRIDDMLHKAAFARAVADMCDPKVSELRAFASTPERMAAWNTLCTPTAVELGQKP